MNANKINAGMKIKVNSFEYSQHLSMGAVITPHKTRKHNGHKSATVSCVWDDGYDDCTMVEVEVNGWFDQVPASAIEPIS